MNRSRTTVSTSSAVSHSRHSAATSTASVYLTPATVRRTRGMDDAVMLKVVAPRPIKITAYAGVAAISPQTTAGMEAPAAAASMREMLPSTAG